MTIWSGQITATINGNINVFFPVPFDGIEKLDTSKLFQQNAAAWSEFGFSVGEEKNLEIPIPSERNTSTSIEFNFDQEIESGVTQGFSDSQAQRFDFLSYDEEDLLDWDAAIIIPPPRPSGTICVKLKYKGRSKPFPVENFWEE